MRGHEDVCCATKAQAGRGCMRGCALTLHCQGVLGTEVITFSVCVVCASVWVAECVCGWPREGIGRKVGYTGHGSRVHNSEFKGPGFAAQMSVRGARCGPPPTLCELCTTLKYVCSAGCRIYVKRVVSPRSHRQLPLVKHGPRFQSVTAVDPPLLIMLPCVRHAWSLAWRRYPGGTLGHGTGVAPWGGLVEWRAQGQA